LEGSSPTATHLRTSLSEGVDCLNLTLTNQQSALLVQFVQLLHKWNRVYNLTAVRSTDEMIGRHILDSLAILNWLPPATAAAASDLADSTTTVTDRFDVIDVGTGAGLPVLPLAIARPDLTFLSVESNGKKTRFQQQAVTELSLSNVRIVQARIEDVVDQAGIVLSRAFTAPDKFLTMVKKNCRAYSRVIIMLGSKERMPEMPPDGFIVTEIQKIDVPQLDSTRHVAVCQYAAMTQPK